MLVLEQKQEGTMNEREKYRGLTKLRRDVSVELRTAGHVLDTSPE